MKAGKNKSIIGRMNRKNGELFEKWLSASCNYYKDKGIACIVKTPEPMKPIRAVGEGRFIACYTQKGQPDYKGILCDGTGIMFEAKHTDSDRINQSVITDTQWKILDIYEKFGASCYVMVSIGLQSFYRVPWDIWKRMKELFGHKYMNKSELEPYKIQKKQSTLLILEGVEIQEGNMECPRCGKETV